MSETAKGSITSWWILALMSLFLWYRNIKYDRALAAFIFTLGLVQLIEYGIQSGTDPNQSGRALFITLWLQCLILAIGVFIFIRSSHDESTSLMGNVIHTIAGWNLFLFAIIFVVALVISFTTDSTFTATQEQSGYVGWYINDTPLISKWGWLYLIGIFVPLLLLFGYYMWADLGIAILILYGALTALYVFVNFQSPYFGSMWSYFAVGFAFLAWFIGMFPQFTDNNIVTPTT